MQGEGWLERRGIERFLLSRLGDYSHRLLGTWGTSIVVWRCGLLLSGGLLSLSVGNLALSRLLATRFPSYFAYGGSMNGCDGVTYLDIMGMM
jgi:hypothetical protein